ncbi:MAG TPA: HAD-IB family hydrolase [Mycobacterium sp.]
MTSFRPGGADGADLAANASAERALDGIPAAAPPPVDLTAAAFFDVDNTLVQGSSLVHFGRGLAARKYFTYHDAFGLLFAQAKFQLTGRENSDDVAAGRRKGLAFIEGRTTAELSALGEEIYDEIIADKIWPGTRDLAQMHLDAGQQVWLVTATPYELAEIIARRLGLTGALGTVVEAVDGVFTGRLVGEILHGAGKAHDALAGHPGGAEPQAVHRLLRQLQRRADAVTGRHRGSDQPRRRPAGARA